MIIPDKDLHADGQVFEKLARPLPPDKIKWRVGNHSKDPNSPWVMILAYISSRDMMDRLDECFGPKGWEVEYSTLHKNLDCDQRDFYVAHFCRITIRTPSGITRTKEDVGDDSGPNAVKGSATVAFRRAAVAWNICNCRSLYGLGTTFAELVDPFDVQFQQRITIGGKKYGWKAPRVINLEDTNQYLAVDKDPGPSVYEETKDSRSKNEFLNNKLRFGKHKGKTWEQVIKSNKSWVHWYLLSGASDKDSEFMTNLLLKECGYETLLDLPCRLKKYQGTKTWGEVVELDEVYVKEAIKKNLKSIEENDKGFIGEHLMTELLDRLSGTKAMGF